LEALDPENFLRRPISPEFVFFIRTACTGHTCSSALSEPVKFLLCI